MQSYAREHQGIVDPADYGGLQAPAMVDELRAGSGPDYQLRPDRVPTGRTPAACLLSRLRDWGFIIGAHA
eukprot:10742186-Alexandrium_andersonii.AAC.1